MTETGNKPNNPQKVRKKERLAAALRENLRRRKAQARKRETTRSEAPPEPTSGQDR